MQTFLVTGVAGFIGSQVARQLIKDGHRVVGIDNMNDYYDVRLKRHRLDWFKNTPSDQLVFVEGDIENQELITDLFEEHDFETVFNLAARAGVRYSVENPHIYSTTNTLATINLLEAMRKANVDNLVLASTSSLYAGQPLPFREEMSVNTPLSPYAASKLAAEMHAYAHHHLFGLNISVVRYFTVYGPAGRPDMCIFRFIQWIDQGKPIQIFGDGRQSRDFTFVEDIARGTISAKDIKGYEVINLGGGKEPTSLLDTIARLEALLGKSAQIEFLPAAVADISETRADISKAERLLGWKPQTSLDDGLRACVDWYLTNRKWCTDIDLS